MPDCYAENSAVISIQPMPAELAQYSELMASGDKSLTAHEQVDRAQRI